jgi:hypothetical protein
MRHLLAAAAVSATFFVAAISTAHAGALVTDVGEFPESSVITFADQPAGFATGPLQVGSSVGLDVVYSASGEISGFSFAGYGLQSNGTYDGSVPYVYVNNGLGSWVRFTLGGDAVAAIGGTVNYAICGGAIGCGSGPFVIRAYGAEQQLLEEYEISSVAPISTPGGVNASAFVGIVRPTADIVAFEISGAAGVMDDLYVAAAAPPADEVCDLDQDGDVDRKDYVAYFRGCRAGSIGGCDKDQDGDFDANDLVAHIRLCSATSARDALPMARAIVEHNSVGTGIRPR